MEAEGGIRMSFLSVRKQNRYHLVSYSGCLNIKAGSGQREPPAWKNENRHPGWGVAELQKKSPPTTGRHAAAVLSNKGIPQFWEM